MLRHDCKYFDACVVPSALSVELLICLAQEPLELRYPNVDEQAMNFMKVLVLFLLLKQNDNYFVRKLFVTNSSMALSRQRIRAFFKVISNLAGTIPIFKTDQYHITGPAAF